MNKLTFDFARYIMNNEQQVPVSIKHTDNTFNFLKINMIFIFFFLFLVNFIWKEIPCYKERLYERISS